MSTTEAHPYLENVLVLSTAHLPRSEPAFGDVRAVPFEYGFIVFVTDSSRVYHWLKPIMEIAERDECTLILFDADGNIDPELTTFDW